MRSPLGTYLARPSGHDSFSSDSSGIHRLPNFAGIVAESICCQMLWRHSLASLEDAVRTIFGEPKESLQELVANQQVNDGRIIASVTYAAKPNVQAILPEKEWRTPETSYVRFSTLCDIVRAC